MVATSSAANIVVTDQFPLVDLAIIFASVSAYFHIVCAENAGTTISIDGESTTLEAAALARGINRTRWLDYSLSASTMVIVVSSLCGVTDVYSLGLQALLQFVLLDVAAAVEVELSLRPPGFGLQDGLMVLYALYFLPLIAAAAANAVDERSTTGPIIVVVLTSLHFVAGATLGLLRRKFSSSSSDGSAATRLPLLVAANLMIFVALVTAAIAVNDPDRDDFVQLSTTAIVFGVLGNLGCLYNTVASGGVSEPDNKSVFLERSATQCFFMLSLVFAFMWSPTISVFASAYEKDINEPPLAIISIIIVIITLFSCFALWFFLASVARLVNSESTELGYIVLSFVTKTILHWLLWSGITGREDSIFTEFNTNTTEIPVASGMADEPADVGVSIGVPLLLGIGLSVYGSMLLTGKANLFDRQRMASFSANELTRRFF